MPDQPIILNGRQIPIHRATLDAKMGDPTVLTSDFWSYVELWLRRNRSYEAMFYWEQAREFYEASRSLSSISAPLTLYYSFLNATKALLEYNNVAVGPFHGTSGRVTTKKATLAGELVKFGTKGVAPALANLLGDKDTRGSYTLKQILYNLPFIHRAYTITFSKQPELFVPLREFHYVRKVDSSESWILLSLDIKSDPQQIISLLPKGYERDIGWPEHYLVRTKQRFKWRDGDENIQSNLIRISNYNKKIRQDIKYIRGQPPTWYLKLSRNSPDIIARSTLSLMLSAMHRLSELARYNPVRLKLLLETQQNWLISEFIGSAPLQFLDEIATEMTGQNLAFPFVRLSR